MFILDPGELKIKIQQPIKDKDDNIIFDGNLIQFGGWVVVNPDNTTEINLIDAYNKNELQPNNIDKSSVEQLEGQPTDQVIK